MKGPFCRFAKREIQPMKTYTATPADIDKKWLLVDADGVVLGRLASQVAIILRGKHKPVRPQCPDGCAYFRALNGLENGISLPPI